MPCGSEPGWDPRTEADCRIASWGNARTAHPRRAGGSTCLPTDSGGSHSSATEKRRTVLPVSLCCLHRVPRQRASHKYSPPDLRLVKLRQLRNPRTYVPEFRTHILSAVLYCIGGGEGVRAPFCSGHKWYRCKASNRAIDCPVPPTGVRMHPLEGEKGRVIGNLTLPAAWQDRAME
jgi:hypothetical protein